MVDEGLEGLEIVVLHKLCVLTPKLLCVQNAPSIRKAKDCKKEDKVKPIYAFPLCVVNIYQQVERKGSERDKEYKM